MELFDKDAEPVVQSPPPGKFSSMNVQWQYLRLSNSPYPVQQVCHIPYDRVTDFIRGESDNPEHPTTFRIYSSRRRRRHSKTTATTFRTYSEELTYWCVYGPDTKPRKHKKATSAETKRTRPRVTPSQFQKGCGCHFIVHRLVLLPDAARISYVHPHHTNNEDLVCHAVDLDRLRLGLGVVAPWLSLEIKRWVVAFISAGFTLQQVFDRHVRALHERRQRNLSYQISRDDFLTPKDVSNIAKHLACLRQEVDNEDALSVRLWCLLNKQDVFIYQEQRAEENVHFILGLQTDWQLELMLKLGHGRLIAMNSTLGPHNYKLCLNTIIVFDQHRNAIPVACIITSSAGPTFKQWLQELHKRVLSINSDWKPSAFVIDAAAVDVDVIRSVLNLPSVQLSLWRVRRCWLKHLIQKVKGWSVRAAMLNVLGQIMDITKRSGQGAMQRHRPLVNEFMTQFCDQEEFMAYFRDHWQKKIDMWVWAAQTSIHTNQEVNAALESFYCTLKQQFLKGKDNIQGRSIDWLFHILTTEVAPFFWYQHHARENNIRKPAALPEIEESSIARAFKIPDSDVQYSRNANFPGLGVAHVRSQSRKEVWYEVFNAQSGWACCTCDWAGKGNICKHQLKVTLIEGAPVSSMAPSSNGMADDNFPTNGTLQSELTILEQDAYHETHLSTLLLRENAHQAPCDGLEEDIQRLQQQTLQLAGGNFSLLQLLRDDMMRTQQILLEARSGPLDVIPQASTHFGTL